MNPQSASQPDHQYAQHALINLQPGENVIFQIKQHPIVLISIYGAGLLGLLAFALIIFTVLPGLFPEDKASLASSVGIIVFIVMAAFIFLFVVLLGKIYQGNGCILTNRNLAQVKRITLFNSESVQLSLDKLQDITFDKKGILAYIFGYGIIHCETAGEAPVFMFKYCPNPKFYAQQIISAKDDYMKNYREHPANMNYQQSSGPAPVPEQQTEQSGPLQQPSSPTQDTTTEESQSTTYDQQAASQNSYQPYVPPQQELAQPVNNSGLAIPELPPELQPQQPFTIGQPNTESGNQPTPEGSPPLESEVPR